MRIGDGRYAFKKYKVEESNCSHIFHSILNFNFRQNSRPYMRRRVEQITPVPDVEERNPDTQAISYAPLFSMKSLIDSIENFYKEGRAVVGSELVAPDCLLSSQTRQRLNCLDASVLVQTHSEKLPMTDPLGQDNFFVRSCYPVYYDIIMECFRSGKYDFISVTGSPGIGKSVFYIYFFKRFYEEQTDTAVITAAFDADRAVTKCLVFEHGKPVQSHGDTIPDMDGMYLYDGPPFSPPVDRKMVCFTSPNYAWFNKTIKNKNHAHLIFPTWQLGELREANTACDLKIPDEDLVARFNLFGGVPRYCLTRDSYFEERGRIQLLEKIASVDSYQKLNDCLSPHTNQQMISHQIFHSIPTLINYLPFVGFDQKTICSEQVRIMLEDNLVDKDEERRQEYARYLKGNTQTASLLGWAFEDYCRRQFVDGHSTTMTAISLPCRSKSFDFIVTRHYEHMRRTTESVDAVDFNDEGNHMFQMTVSTSHPVNAHGIFVQLAKRNLLEPFMSGQLLAPVRLFFVVPEDRAEIKKQLIRNKPVYKHSQVSTLSWIHSSTRTELQKRNFITVNDLITANASDAYLVDLEKRYMLLTLLRAHMKNTQNCVTDSIEQFIVIKEGFYRSPSHLSTQDRIARLERELAELRRRV